MQNVILLPKGQEIAQRSTAKVRSINHALLSEFSLNEQETIARFLIHVAQNSEQIVCEEQQR